ncbi:MAG TPA: MliC family protein [Ideonella sp.]|uniref:MliC family protein n=1 Tax=Ideonella sp. TaxID=1929293 RepID=UPI002BD2E698|nr:MliC family protein [Ideonella sp.]HSI50543.1 MliC family protein [Ideonella sp.]
MGGLPEAQPLRYRQASPQWLLPLHVPQYLVSAEVLLPEAAQAYQAKARALGDEVELLPLPGAGHYDPLQPGLPAGEAVRRLIVERAFTPPFNTSSVNYRCAAGKHLSAAYLNLRGGESFAVLSWQGRQEVLRAGPTGSGVRYAALPGAVPGAASAGLVWQTKGPEGILSQELGQATRTLAFDCKPER